MVTIDLDIETLKQVTEDEMYFYLSKKLERVLNKYRYLEVSKKDICKFLKAKLRFIKVNNYLRVLTFDLEAYFKEILEAKLKEEPYLVVENFIKYNLKETTNFKEGIIYLKKLKGFLGMNKIKQDDLLEKLIKENRVVLSLLELVVSEIQKDKTKALAIDSNTLKELVDLFCLTRNIDLSLDNDLKVNFKRQTESLNSYDLYITEVANIPLLTEEEEQELFIEYKNGSNEAKKKIIAANLRLVVKLARRFYHSNSKYAFLDLVDVGNMGLVNAVSLYDLNYGTRFSTYAYHWISRYIKEFIKSQTRLVHIPMHLYDRLFKIIKIRNEVAGISEKEIAERLGLSEKEVKDLLKYEKEALSLNGYTSGDEDTELEDLALIDYEALEEFNKVDKSLDFQDIINQVPNLTEREKLILKLVYVEQKNYVLIEKETGIAKTMIRFLHDKALRKIRRSKDLIFSLAVYTSNPKECIRNLGYEDFEYKEYMNYNDSNKNSRINTICKLFLDFRAISKKYYLVSKYFYRDIIILALKSRIFGDISDIEIASYFEISLEEVLNIYINLQLDFVNIKEYYREFGSYLYKNKSEIQVQNIKTKKIEA